MQVVARCHINRVTYTVTCMGAMSLWPTMHDAFLIAFVLLAAVVLVPYTRAVLAYHRAHLRQLRSKDETPRVPPTYPVLVLVLDLIMGTMGLDPARFMRKATKHGGVLTSRRISFAGFSLYLFQDRGTVKSILRKSRSLTSNTIRYVLPGKYLFGMPEHQGLDAYRADNSGPLPKPFPGSNVLPESRVDYIHHQTYLRALTGPGLLSYTSRYRAAFHSRIESRAFVASQWTNLDNMFDFISREVASALTESVFGAALLKRHPDIMNHIWAYDKAAPWFAKMIPSWLYSKPHKSRERLSRTFKEWNQHARQQVLETKSNGVAPNQDYEYDPVWGSGLVRDLQQALFETGKHSEDAMAAHDSGVLWATTTNPASAAALAAFHIFRDRPLLSRLRAEISSHFPQSFSTSPLYLPPKELYNLPLLSSIYAETLRLYSQIFLVRSSPPDTDVRLGEWIFPRSSIGVICTSVAHTDDSFWNTRGGQYPLDTFWAERFLIYPGDPSSGPINPNLAASTRIRRAEKTEDDVETGAAVPYFSTEGLEGSWIPYGAGLSQCPGRLLAKDAIMATCILLVRDYDIEIDTGRLDIDLWRFGLGVARPKNRIVARIRRRSPSCI